MLEKTCTLSEPVSFKEEFNAENEFFYLNRLTVLQVKEVKAIHCITEG